MRPSKIKRNKYLEVSIQCPRSLYKRERRELKHDSWRRRKYYFEKTPRPIREVARLRFTPLKINVRCCNKIHVIELTETGRLRLHGHPDIQAELMLGMLGGECRCLDIYKAWTEEIKGYSTEAGKVIPPELTPAFRSLGVVTRRRSSLKRGCTPRLSCARDTYDEDHDDYVSAPEIDSDGLLGQACYKILAKSLKEAGIEQEVIFRHLRIYNDLILSDEIKARVCACHAINIRVNNDYWISEKDGLAASGRVPLSAILRMKRGQGFVAGHLFIGHDHDSGEDFYLRQFQFDKSRWVSNSARLEGGELKWTEE